MSIEAWDDRTLKQGPTAACSNCGEAVLVWVRIESHDGCGGVSLCPACLDDANAALAEKELIYEDDTEH